MPDRGPEDIAAQYAAERDRLLARVTRLLGDDPRVPAAWLTGSFGRGEADRLSDLDLTVVVADAASERLCARPWQVGAGTTEERLALVGSVGEPVVLHENHHNAPAGGSFTHVVYAGMGVSIDWVLVPQSRARRPEPSRLLFDDTGVPLQAGDAPESPAARAEAAAERVAFFWMVAFPATKAALRREPVEFQLLLVMLHETVRDIERLIRGEPWRYRRASGAPLATSYPEQAAALRALCERVRGLGPTLAALGAEGPDAPMAAIEALPMAAIEALLAAGPPRGSRASS